MIQRSQRLEMVCKLTQDTQHTPLDDRRFIYFPTLRRKKTGFHFFFFDLFLISKFPHNHVGEATLRVDRWCWPVRARDLSNDAQWIRLKEGEELSTAHFRILG